MTDTLVPRNRLERLVARIPPHFGRTRHDVHYWLFSPVCLGQLLAAAQMRHLTWVSALLLFAAGVFAWSLLEYLLHRFSFHSTSEHPLVRPFNSGLHMLHHQDPSSLLYVGAPIVLAVPVYGITLALFRLASGSWDRALVLGSGLIAAFLFYEFAHLTAHQRSPRTAFMKYLKKHHMRHHYGDEQRLYGVTSPLWDYVFRTHWQGGKQQIRARKQPPSPKSAAS